MKKIMVRCFLFVFLLFLLWLGGLLFYGFSSVQMQADDDLEADGIVVLTGGDYRISTGFSLFAQGRAPQMLITGIHPNVTREQVRQKYDGEIPPCCLTYGYEARTTIGNGEETRQWAETIEGLDSLILVTSEYHMHRGVLEVQHALPGVTIYPYPVRSPYGYETMVFIRLLVLEYHKFLYRAFMMIVGAA